MQFSVWHRSHMVANQNLLKDVISIKFITKIDAIICVLWLRLWLRSSKDGAWNVWTFFHSNIIKKMCVFFFGCFLWIYGVRNEFRYFSIVFSFEQFIEMRIVFFCSFECRHCLDFTLHITARLSKTMCNVHTVPFVHYISIRSNFTSNPIWMQFFSQPKEYCTYWWMFVTTSLSKLITIHPEFYWNDVSPRIFSINSDFDLNHSRMCFLYMYEFVSDVKTVFLVWLWWSHFCIPISRSINPFNHNLY